MALQDEAFEVQDPSGRSDPGLASEAHLEPRPPAEALLKHEEHRGVRLEERLRELQRVVDAERWRVEKRLEREAGGEALELSASTESLPSSAAFDDSAISSEGEESEEGGEAGEGSEAGGEPQAGRAEAGRCEGAEPVRLDPKHRASLEEFTLLERACREEPAVKGTRCEGQGSRDLSKGGEGEGFLPSDRLPPATAAGTQDARRGDNQRKRAGRKRSPVMPTVLDFSALDLGGWG